MVELRSKSLIKTSQVGYGMKLAVHLKKMNLDAVVRSNLQRLPNENYKVILMDYADIRGENEERLTNAQMQNLPSNNLPRFKKQTKAKNLSSA